LRSAFGEELAPAALSGIMGALMWILREHNIFDGRLEQQIYRSTSNAIVTAHPQTEAAADRLILAVQAATGAVRPASSPPSGA
jgi:hypothetical protein